MTPDDLEFARAYVAWQNYCKEHEANEVEDNLRIISLLIAEMARGDKAEHEVIALKGNRAFFAHGNCYHCDWADADWLQQAEEKVRGK